MPVWCIVIRCDAELVEVNRCHFVFLVKCFENETLIGEGAHEGGDPPDCR